MKMWFSCKNFKSQFCCAYFDYVIPNIIFLTKLCGGVSGTVSYVLNKSCLYGLAVLGKLGSTKDSCEFGLGRDGGRGTGIMVSGGTGLGRNNGRGTGMMASVSCQKLHSWIADFFPWM